MCDIILTTGNNSVVQSNGYTYSVTKTAQISDVTPRRGGTGGGTKVTITGQGFGSGYFRLVSPINKNNHADTASFSTKPVISCPF